MPPATIMPSPGQSTHCSTWLRGGLFGRMWLWISNSGVRIQPNAQPSIIQALIRRPTIMPLPRLSRL